MTIEMFLGLLFLLFAVIALPVSVPAYIEISRNKNDNK